jgi:hypothetical protein
MRNTLFTNRFVDRASQAASRQFTSRAFGAGSFMVVREGKMMDPFYRDPSESPHPGKGREKHFGADITGPTAGKGDIKDPRRGLPVYAAINTVLSIEELNKARAYNKNAGENVDSLSIPGSGNANMVEAKVYLQPWASTEDHSYGGVVGMSCIYSYTNNSGATAEFTLYIEFLHLITDRFLPKDSTGRIASAEEWTDTGRGIGFGPDLKDGDTVKPGFFIGPGFPIIGYLGATQTPHVHVQVAFFNSRTFSKVANIRVNPLAVVY